MIFNIIAVVFLLLEIIFVVGIFYLIYVGWKHTHKKTGDISPPASRRLKTVRIALLVFIILFALFLYGLSSINLPGW